MPASAHVCAHSLARMLRCSMIPGVVHRPSEQHVMVHITFPLAKARQTYSERIMVKSGVLLLSAAFLSQVHTIVQWSHEHYCGDSRPQVLEARAIQGKLETVRIALLLLILCRVTGTHGS